MFRLTPIPPESNHLSMLRCLVKGSAQKKTLAICDAYPRCGLELGPEGVVRSGSALRRVLIGCHRG
jgi:hypothetical protein